MPNERSVATIMNNTGTTRLLPRGLPQGVFRHVGDRRYTVNMNARSSLPVQGRSLSNWGIGSGGYATRTQARGFGDDIDTVRKTLASLGLKQDVDYLTPDNQTIVFTKSASSKIVEHIRFILRLQTAEIKYHTALYDYVSTAGSIGIDVTIEQALLAESERKIEEYRQLVNAFIAAFEKPITETAPEKLPLIGLVLAEVPAAQFSPQGMAIIAAFVTVAAVVWFLSKTPEQIREEEIAKRKKDASDAAIAWNANAKLPATDPRKITDPDALEALNRLMNSSVDSYEELRQMPLPTDWPASLKLIGQSLLWGSAIWIGYQVWSGVWSTIAAPHAGALLGGMRGLKDWWSISPSNTPAIATSSEWEEPTPSDWVSGSYPAIPVAAPLGRVKIPSPKKPKALTTTIKKKPASKAKARAKP